MRVIGVIDLLAGRAVHAAGGVREAYRSVDTVAGCPVDGDPMALARAYVDQVGISELYAADLDAIRGRPLQHTILAALAGVAPLWADAGVSSPLDARHVADLGAAHVVIGLETLASLDALPSICEAVGRDRAAFSLDLYLGNPVVAREDVTRDSAAAIAARAADAGVGAIIVLDLGRVGADTGPDVELIARVRSAAQAPALLAGGGVRSRDDVVRLCEIGCDGVLLATALHRGRISATMVASFLRLEGHGSARR